MCTLKLNPSQKEKSDNPNRTYFTEDKEERGTLSCAV